MKRQIIILICIFIEISAFAQKNQFVRYESASGKIIRFYKDGTFDQGKDFGEPIIDYPYPYMDNLSYGKYIKEGKYYVLKSSPEIDYLSSDKYASQRIDSCISNKDSLVVEILSPYEQLLEKYPSYKKVFFYIVKIECEKDSVSQIYEKEFNSTNTYSFSNRMAFFKPDLVKLKTVTIYIYPHKYRYPLFYDSYVINHSISNDNANYVLINLAHFDYFYLAYIRYYCNVRFHNIAKIVNRKSIVLNNELYVRDDGRKRDSDFERWIRWQKEKRQILKSLKGKYPKRVCDKLSN